MSLLSSSDADRVRQAVALVEKRTAGELVVALTRQSDDYAFHRGLLCTTLIVVGGWLGHELLPLLAAEYLFAGQGLLWIALWYMTGWAPLTRLIVPKAHQAACVEARTKQAFIEQGVTETRDRSGVLIFVSETEHRVHILADRGIHTRVTDAGWAKHVQAIVAAIRRGQTADGLCRAIEDIGEELALAFPPREDDENELPDDVVRL